MRARFTGPVLYSLRVNADADQRSLLNLSVAVASALLARVVLAFPSPKPDGLFSLGGDRWSPSPGMIDAAVAAEVLSP